jgi:small subunit ribosomal protein S2
MRRLPEMLIVIDTRREATAIKEANTLNIPVLALADTNSDPDVIDYIIPANDDAVRAIKLLVAAIADAVIEGQSMRKQEDLTEDEQAEEAAFAFQTGADEGEDDEAFLGESTLAKIRNQRLLDEEEEE